VETGVYEGTYTISKRDRITADSKATANLRLGNKVASAILDESLVATAAARRPAAAASPATVPKIDRFDVEPPSRLVAGADLIFTLTGSPGGTASVRIVGVKGKIVLDEVRQGVYEAGTRSKTVTELRPMRPSRQVCAATIRKPAQLLPYPGCGPASRASPRQAARPAQLWRNRSGKRGRGQR